MSTTSRRKYRTWPSDVLCSELVQVLAKSRLSPGASIVAIVEAISRTEAVLSSEAPMRRGGAIQVNASSWSFRARVVGCRKDKELRGYAVLVRFEDPFCWTAAAFCPAHMLELTLEPAPARVLTAGQSFGD